jgi:hypothetical protein
MSEKKARRGILGVRHNDNERAAWVAAATDARRTLSDWVRDVLNQASKGATS